MKTAFVTGATAGIGEATVRTLVASGWRCVATGRRKERLDALVAELGADHQGEIKKTVAWVRPKVALINNVNPAHLEGFGSMEGIALAKSEIFFGCQS